MHTIPDRDEVLASCHVVSIPMRVRFRGIEHREAVLFEGPSGWGEFAPFLEYGDAESARWLAAGIESAYAAEPARVRDVVSVNATVPAVAAESVGAVLARFDGCTTAKVKVAERGQALADDVDRVAAAREAMGPHGRIRIDANGGWDVETAAGALGKLTAYGLEYAEQPCATVEELAELRACLARRGIDVLIAADESIRRAGDPLRVSALEAADLIVVKAAPLGGVAAALEIVEASGLPAVVSSALDTSVGIAAGVRLAAALPTLDHACGLGTVGLFADDVVDPPMAPVAGVLRPARPDPSVRRLAALAPSPGRQAWWRDRLGRAFDQLVADGAGR